MTITFYPPVAHRPLDLSDAVDAVRAAQRDPRGTSALFRHLASVCLPLSTSRKQKADPRR